MFPAAIDTLFPSFNKRQTRIVSLSNFQRRTTSIPPTQSLFYYFFGVYFIFFKGSRVLNCIHEQVFFKLLRAPIVSISLVISTSVFVSAIVNCTNIERKTEGSPYSCISYPSQFFTLLINLSKNFYSRPRSQL